MIEAIWYFLTWFCFIPIAYLQFGIGSCNENIALAILVIASSIVIVGWRLEPHWRILLWSLSSVWLSGLVFAFSQLSVRQLGTMFFGGFWLLDWRMYNGDFGAFWWAPNMAAFVMLSTVLLKLLIDIFYRREKDEQSVE